MGGPRPIGDRPIGDRSGDARAGLAASYARCRRIHAEHGRSYYLATLLLPRWKRPHVHALYGFTRHADDIVDDPGSPLSARQRAERLAGLHTELRAALAGDPVTDPILPAVAHTVRAFGIATADLDTFLASMTADTIQSGYQSYADLLGYMEGSAAAIGSMMLPILAPSDVDGAREPARQLGFAFQLTNFLRDVGEDLDRGRVYLPTRDLAAFGLTRDHLRADRATGRASQPLRALLRFEAGRAHDHYARAEPGINLLAPSSRPCIRAALELYRGILDEIERADFEVLRARVRVPRRRRLAIAARHLVAARAAERAERRAPAAG
ncbi:MAG TPA: phytoene/squalene synthase family protein [Mycobacteriales bacterium]|nr:phytoene/squalene synthase family protein [Mycobacteriales bacterium]